MNTGRRPDLLGVCEVENRFVVDRLIDRVNATLPTLRSYAVVHADTDDARGIDVAFIYDDTLFQVPCPLKNLCVLPRGDAPPRHPRDRPGQLQTTTAAARTWAVFGNHWPSSAGDQFESAGCRDIAGETLSYLHQRVLEVHGRQTPVLAMGDFNDEPFDVSLFRHALSTRQRAKVTSGREEPLLWNRMWPIAGVPDGSFYFDNQPNMLDQFTVNKNMAIGRAGITVNPATVEIFRLAAIVNPGSYPKPIPFGGIGQAGQSKRILRPFPHHHDSHRSRLGRAASRGQRPYSSSPIARPLSPWPFMITSFAFQACSTPNAVRRVLSPVQMGNLTKINKPHALTSACETWRSESAC
jgi:hypothetical protein